MRSSKEWKAKIRSAREKRLNTLGIPQGKALDLLESTPVARASVSITGTVSYAGCLRYGYGCHIIINHSNGYQTLYGHLSSIGVSAGQGIGRGQQIGNVGSTGRSTGPHLHFEVRSGGRLVNPLGFLK